MKKLQIIAWSIFFIGILLKLFHFPFASQMLILGTLLLVIHSLIYFGKNANTNLANSFLHLTFAFMTAYVLFRIQYWSCGPMILGYSLFFLLVLVIFIICLVLHVTHKPKFRVPQLILLLYFLFFYILSFTHSYDIYYFVYLNPVLNGESREINYHSWDKYSWFLYIAGKKEEALEANYKAEEAIKNSLKIGGDNLTIEYEALIKLHQQQILDGNWTIHP